VLERGAKVVHATRTTFWAAAALAGGLHTIWHWRGLNEGGFQNFDVAGIAYNARLLLAGQLPYVDSAEFKSPLSFFLFAPLLSLGSMRAVWIASLLWATATSLATGLVAASAWGERWGPRAVILHAAGAFPTSLGDVNYPFWMTLPFVLTAALAFDVPLGPFASTRPSPRRVAARWAAVGALAATAFLFKHNAAALVIVVLGALWREYGRAGTRRALLLAASGAAGAVLVAGLVALPWAARGRLAALLNGLGVGGSLKSEYVWGAVDAAGGFGATLIGGVRCVTTYLPLGIGLVAAGLLPVGYAIRRWGRRAPLQPETPNPAHFPAASWIFALASLVAFGLTMRFFLSEFVVLWPALVIIALRPAGVLGWLVERLAAEWSRILVMLGLGLSSSYASSKLALDVQRDLVATDRFVAAVCKAARPILPPSQPVLGWGWRAWSVYEHCQRRAPGIYYKELVTVTTPNTNSCANFSGGPIRLRQGPAAQRWARDLFENPPALVLLSDYYRTMGDGVDPLDDWSEVRGFLESRYLLAHRSAHFRGLLRKDVAARLGETSGSTARPAR
jgi:hypothetical protein